MDPRYARTKMTAIWSAENRFRIWFEIEAHATDALAELGTVPKSAAKALWDWWATSPAIDVAAIDAIEAVTKHDVIARSEEHTSELQSLMRISYAVFCLKKKQTTTIKRDNTSAIRKNQSNRAHPN